MSMASRSRGGPHAPSAATHHSKTDSQKSLHSQASGAGAVAPADDVSSSEYWSFSPQPPQLLASNGHHRSFNNTATPAHNAACLDTSPDKGDNSPVATLDPSPEHHQARTELLREANFPAWQHDAGRADLDDPQELQKKDPLGTQIWKLYSKTKSQLPNQERMENLSWRMMAMNLKRREQAAARYVRPPPLPLQRHVSLSFSFASYLHSS